LLPYPDYERRGGVLVESEPGTRTRLFGFGDGPVRATSLTWGDAVTAFHTTGIPNIENYIVVSPAVRAPMRLLRRIRRLLAPAPVRAVLGRFVRPGPPAE